MQYIKSTIILVFTCINLASYSQSNLADFLGQVKVNNKSLKAAKKLYDLQLIETRYGLTPENPEFEMGYFPGNSSEIGTKKVIGISQTFSFPTTYINQNKLAKTKSNAVLNSYQKTEIEILNQAKYAWNRAIYLNKNYQILEKRKNDAELLYNNYLKKQENGDATQLEVNKAHLFFLSLQNSFRKIKSEKEQNHEVIKLLNGGVHFEINDTVYSNIRLASWKNIKSDLLSNHPALQKSEINKTLSQQALKLEKSKWLPELSIGYENETILNDTYSGIKGGIAIPLWKEKNNLKIAKASIALSAEEFETERSNIETEYFKRFLYSETLQKNYISFNEKLRKMNNVRLLQKSLELGQISAIEYFIELDYFYGIYDELLVLELEFNLSRVSLFDYKL